MDTGTKIDIVGATDRVPIRPTTTYDVTATHCISLFLYMCVSVKLFTYSVMSDVYECVDEIRRQLLVACVQSLLWE